VDDGVFQVVFVFEQKTPYDVSTCLEFRRVLFRSRHLAAAADGDAVQRAVDVAGRRRNRAGAAQRAAVDDGVLQVERAGGGVDLEIGRASCREREWVAGGGGRAGSADGGRVRGVWV